MKTFDSHAPSMNIQHVLTSAAIRQEFESSTNCLPQCKTEGVHQTDTDYTIMGQLYTEYLISTHQTDTNHIRDYTLLSTEIKVAEKPYVTFDEQAEYTYNALLADIGGSLGLWLGLNIFDPDF